MSINCDICDESSLLQQIVAKIDVVMSGYNHRNAGLPRKNKLTFENHKYPQINAKIEILLGPKDQHCSSQAFLDKYGRVDDRCAPNVYKL